MSSPSLEEFNGIKLDVRWRDPNGDLILEVGDLGFRLKSSILAGRCSVIDEHLNGAGGRGLGGEGLESDEELGSDEDGDGAGSDKDDEGEGLSGDQKEGPTILSFPELRQEDIRYFLDIMERTYGGKVVDIAEPPFIQVASIAKVAQVLGAPRFCHEALKILLTVFTNKHSVFKKIYPPRDDAPRPRVVWSPTDAITAVNLAWTTRCYMMLPVALYLCCTLPVDELERGAKREDNYWDLLTSKNLRRCMSGRSSLGRMRGRMCSIALVPRCSGYRSATCQEFLQGVYSRHLSANPHPETVQCDDIHAILYQLRKEIQESRSAIPSLCEVCIAYCTARLDEEEQWFWKKLPAITDVATVVPAQWYDENTQFVSSIFRPI